MPSSPAPRGNALSLSLPLCYALIANVCLRNSGIGLETSILFAKEGASVLMSDISAPALEKALAKVKQLVPSAVRVETKVLPPFPSPFFPSEN